MSIPNDRERARQARDQALAQLFALRRQALQGTYDEAEFEHALQAYRDAEALVQRLTAATWAYQVHDDQATRARPVGPAPGGAAPGGGVAAGSSTRAGSQPGPAALADTSEAQTEAFVPTKRMRFVKWLVETGRISDYR